MILHNNYTNGRKYIYHRKTKEKKAKNHKYIHTKIEAKTRGHGKELLLRWRRSERQRTTSVEGPCEECEISSGRKKKK